MAGGCEGLRARVARLIDEASREAEEAVAVALERLDWALLERAFKALERLLELRGDLDMWRPGECFDAGEFYSRIRAVRQGLRRALEASQAPQR